MTDAKPVNGPIETEASQADTARSRLFRSKVDVAMAAEFAVAERMDLGAEKHDPDSWRSESLDRHIRRAIKHALTFLEIRDGDRDDDSTGHLSAAVCRMSMALANSNLATNEIEPP